MDYLEALGKLVPIIGGHVRHHRRARRLPPFNVCAHNTWMWLWYPPLRRCWMSILIAVLIAMIAYVIWDIKNEEG